MSILKELLLEATSDSLSTVKVEALGDGKFLVSCKETKGPMLAVISSIASHFEYQKGVLITTKSGLPADYKRLMSNKYNAFIFKFSKPDGAKERLEKVAQKALKAKANSIAKEAKWKAGAADRKKEAQRYYADERKKNVEELEKLYGKGTYKRVKYRQVGGDDGYQYVVFVDGRPKWNGLTQSEARYYAKNEMDNIAKKEHLGKYSKLKESVVPHGWEGTKDGIITKSGPNGGIIDKNIVSGKWFIIFHNDKLETVDNIPTREEAIKIFNKTVK
jgi:hypothetical protein